MHEEDEVDKVKTATETGRNRGPNDKGSIKKKQQELKMTQTARGTGEREPGK